MKIKAFSFLFLYYILEVTESQCKYKKKLFKKIILKEF